MYNSRASKAKQSEVKKKPFDPLEYIENAFLDTRPQGTNADGDLSLPSLGDYLNASNRPHRVPKTKYRRTQMQAPRPRKPKTESQPVNIDPNLNEAWEALPKTIQFLCLTFDDSVTANYYRGDFKESRIELVKRILDPELTLEETSRILGVCPTTVRRYTNRGWLEHQRTVGGQRRFRLSAIIRFVETHGRFPAS